MKVVKSLSAAALALGLMALPVSAQVAGLPVNYAPMGTGVTIHGTYGAGINDNSGKIGSVGGGVTLGLPTFQVGAAVSYFGISDTEPQEISFGGHAAYMIPLGPEAPVNVAVVAGASVVSISATGGDITTLFIPAGVTLSIDVPSTSVAITPWVSPQFRYVRISNGASVSNSDFGVSGGLNVTLPMGLGLSGQVDYDNNSEAFVVGAGLFYSIKVPSLGGGGM